MEKRKRFSAEFKREAVRLMRDSGKPVATVARELGVPRNRLYKWQQDLEKKQDAAFSGSGRRPEPENELARLRRENERLKEENIILKKAAAYFAKELP
jgi:transposase